MRITNKNDYHLHPGHSHPRYLHLGASRLELLSAGIRAALVNDSWIHLGDPSPIAGLNRFSILGQLREAMRRWRSKLSAPTLDQLYNSTDFRPWVYRAHEALEFDDCSFDFIFSEHFFEHLTMVEAMALLRECRRVLSPKGVIRIVVPDADLRTYGPPEPIGFPSRFMRDSHPQKHRSRWTVYTLSEALNLVGFRPKPLVYCTLDGQFIQTSPNPATPPYRSDSGPIVFRMDYISRPMSLIVDGIVPDKADA
jgi:predicted SAM-dependent methyltransferase